jgi:putative ABC transport system substrate-binding protein
MVNLELIAITEADRWLLGADDCQFNDGSVTYPTGFSDCHVCALDRCARAGIASKAGQVSMINRRTFLWGLTLGAFAAPFAAEAEQRGKVPRIAFLAGGSRSGDSVLLESFWRRMKELGYIEGQSIFAEYRFAEGAVERLPTLADEVVRLHVDVIVAPGSGAVAAKKATDRIPIVVAYGDPVAQGLVVSLARPGGNVTGLSGFISELGAKQLELLKEAFPQFSRVAVISWAAFHPNILLLRDMKVAAEKLHVTLQVLELRGVEDLEPAFSAIKAERAEALITLRNPLSATHRARIVEFAARSRLPAIYPDREFGEAGGLMSYGVNVADLWGRAATYVDKILKGAKPADLPIEQPTKFELVVNMKTAKALGLTTPPSLLLRADQVIE